MAYTPLKISIPEPCSENWEAMHPVSGTTARHCDSCVKNVVDFTGFSDSQLNAYVREEGVKICGRFRPDQLGRPLRAASKPTSNPLRIAATAAGLMLAASSCETNQVVEEQIIEETVTEVLTDGLLEFTPPAEDLLATHRLTGEIAPVDYLEETDEDIIEMAVPGMVSGGPPPPPPPPPPIAGGITVEEVGEFEVLEEELMGDVMWEAPAGYVEEEIIASPPPPPPLPPPPGSVCSKQISNLDSLILPVGDTLHYTTPHDATVMGMVRMAPPEPTGMDYIIDSIKSLLPPSTRPDIQRTSHLRPRPNAAPPHLQEVNLFPNPFVDKVNLEIDVPEASILTVEFLDLNGRLILSQLWRTTPGYNTLILKPRQRKLKGSMFYVRITDELNRNVTKPLVKR
jgi:hypothetical protein